MVGSRKGILRRQDASVAHLIIRRRKCTDCGRISHELPDIIVPFKRHEAANISQALEEHESSRQDSYCENSTIRRWKLWFFLLRDYLESSVRALMELWHCAAFVRLPLYPLEHQTDGWLKNCKKCPPEV